MIKSFGSCGTCYYCYILYLISIYIKVKYSYQFYCALASYCCRPKKRSNFFGKLSNFFCSSCAENVLFLQRLHSFHYCMNENWASNYLVGISLLFQVYFQIFFFFWVSPVIHQLSVLMLKFFFKISNRIVEYPLFSYFLTYYFMIIYKCWKLELENLYSHALESCSSSWGRFQPESEITKRGWKVSSRSLEKSIFHWDHN